MCDNSNLKLGVAVFFITNIKPNLNTTNIMMNLNEITQRINLEIQEISKKMQAVIDQDKSTTAFVKHMYNQFNIICL